MEKPVTSAKMKVLSLTNPEKTMLNNSLFKLFPHKFFLSIEGKPHTNHEHKAL